MNTCLHGPWTLSSNYTDILFQGKHVATTATCELSRAEAVACARMIAMAPELLRGIFEATKILEGLAETLEKTSDMLASKNVEIPPGAEQAALNFQTIVHEFKALANKALLGF